MPPLSQSELSVGTHPFTNERGEILGYLVIDTIIDGRCCGGLRMAEDLTAAELEAPANMMTAKYAYLGIRLGGAKAGILCNPDKDPQQKHMLLQQAGIALAPFLNSGRYITGLDFGTTVEDLNILLASSGLQSDLNIPMNDLSGRATAMSVFASLRTVCQILGTSLSGGSVAIEGFGKVGMELARIITSAGGRVVAVSTSQGGIFSAKGIDINVLSTLHEHHKNDCVKHYRQAEQLKRTNLTSIPCDVYAPCSRLFSITNSSIGSLSARIVCGGSNLQVIDGLEAELHRRGIFYVPPYIANCGAVLWGVCKKFGLSYDFFHHILNYRLQPITEILFRKSLLRGSSPLALGNWIVQERLLKMAGAGADPLLSGRVRRLGRWANGHGLVPRKIAQTIGKREIEASMMELSLLMEKV